MARALLAIRCEMRDACTSSNYRERPTITQQQQGIHSDAKKNSRAEIKFEITAVRIFFSLFSYFHSFVFYTVVFSLSFSFVFFVNFKEKKRKELKRKRKE